MMSDMRPASEMYAEPGRAFPVLDVTTWAVDQPESGGRGTNTWIIDPEGRRWLHKFAKVRPDRREGQDWAEKISAELAGHLGIPSAQIELAVRSGLPGCISADLKPGPAWEFQTGSVLMAHLLPGFLPKTKSRTGHNLKNLRTVLEQVRPPAGLRFPDNFGAFEAFCGFLVFDALIAYRDRHVQNWSVIRGPFTSLGLAPTYDHGSSLGFNLLDVQRERLLVDPEKLESWARQGTAHKFEDGHGRSLVEFAHLALTMAAPTTWDFWAERLDSLDPATCETVIWSVPGCQTPRVG